MTSSISPVIIPDKNQKQPFIYPRDFLRNVDKPFTCVVIPFQTPLLLHWRYNAEQILKGYFWECGEVWLHCAAYPDNHNYSKIQYDRLQEALSILENNKNFCPNMKHSLLVSQDGLYYNKRRIGGDYHITLSSGHHFTFSVWRSDEHDIYPKKALLAIAWDT